MINDGNLQRAVYLLLRRCGPEGPARALTRAATLRAKGQHRDAEVWKDIAALAARDLAVVVSV